MNYFEYKGIRSSDMGIRIESKNVFSGPEYEMDFLSIPGRDGDLIADGGRFPNVQVTYTVFIPAKTTTELANKITAVKNWLYSGLNSYHTLSDTYDTAFFRYGVFAGKLDIEDELTRIGLCTISFSCKPFRYSADGQSEVSLTESGILSNPYPFTSKPTLTLNGSGEGTMTIQSADANATWTFTDVDGLVIDSEQMLCYSGTESRNDTVSGDGFPLLYPGDSTISFTGGITAVTILPRWCSL